MSKDITDELIIREETSGYSFEKSKGNMDEDIKILEEMIENANIENMDMNDCFGGEHIEAIEHILSDYKRVLKINEVLLKENEELKKYKEYYSSARQLVDNNYIHKQKIKDIIDRIDYDIKKTKEIISNDRRSYYQIVRLRAMNTKSLDIKKRLQELLESEEQMNEEEKKAIERIKEDSTFRERSLLRIIDKLQKENEELKSKNKTLEELLKGRKQNVQVL